MSALAVGLMSGTSLDGVSTALVRIEGRSSIQLIRLLTVEYSTEQRELIRGSIRGGTARSLALLNVSLGEWFADATLALLRETDTRPADLAFVASHGQTIWHEPRKATLQLGDPAVIAERVGVRVVSDFRSRDVAAGGEGAPLVPIADALLFGRAEGPRILLNLGGIANVSWIPRQGETNGIIGFDTGPGVALIDAIARGLTPPLRFDANGARAARGRAAESVVSTLLEHPFFAAKPPKSTGREVFGDEFAARLVQLVRAHDAKSTDDDCLATAVRLTARSVAEQVTRWLPATFGVDVLASGGGARNGTLLAGLRDALPGRPVKRFSDVFFDGDAKECVAFALMGWLTLAGQPGNVPSATGARGPRVLGRITPA